MRLAFAFLSAVFLPAMLMTAWYLYGQFEIFKPDDPYIWVRTRSFFVATLIISGGFVLLLGLPTYLLLRYLKYVRWWSTLLAGFILGSVPMAIFTWPLKYSELKSSSTVNGVQTMIDGTPTIAGWIQFVEGVSFFGACGFVAALAFWLVYPNKGNQAEIYSGARFVPENPSTKQPPP